MLQRLNYESSWKMLFAHSTHGNVSVYVAKVYSCLVPDVSLISNQSPSQLHAAAAVLCSRLHVDVESLYSRSVHVIPK